MSGGTWRVLRRNKTLQYGLPMLGEVQKEKTLTLYQLPQRSCKQIRHEIAHGESSGIGKESYEMTYKNKTKGTAFRKLLIVGGSFGLREFTQIRYDAQKLKGKLDPALEEQIGKKKVSLEAEYEKLKEKDLDDWKNIRGPRPWEDSKSLQDQQRGDVTSSQS